MNWKNIVSPLLGAVLLAGSLAGFSGCSRSVVSPRFNAPGFTVSDLRAAPSLLVVAPAAQVRGFQKSYAALFQDSAALQARLSAKILDSLKKDFAVSVAPMAPDSVLKPKLTESGSRHAILVRAVSIEESETEMPRGILPGPTGGLEPAGGGIRKTCVVLFEVEIRNVDWVKVHEFNVRAEADLPLYAYKTTLLNALDAAARKTAAHLLGRP